VGVISFSSRYRERATRKRSLERRLSPDAMKRVARQPELLALSAKTRVMSHLDCRIRGFSEIADSFARDPEGLARFARRAMTPLAQTVLDRGGALDRIEPGGFTAFFNAPLDDPDHAIHACESALAMLQALEKVNRALDHATRPDGTPLGPIGIGIGVSTGEGIVGDFGTEGRPAYTVVGHAAARAHTLETLSADYGTAILADAKTQEHADANFAFLEADLMNQDGAMQPLFTLTGNRFARSNPKFMAVKVFHDRIFAAYRAREWEKARGLIAQAQALSGANPVLYDVYMKRIAHFLEHPPSSDWDGVFV
jgi:adenylate cyclase